ncbi:MAG: hypothetical protein ACFFB5_04375 [Promethearchaeota archaeon]
MISKLEMSNWKEELIVILAIIIGSVFIIIANFSFGLDSNLINYVILLIIIISTYFWLNKEPWTEDYLEKQSEQRIRRPFIDESFKESPMITLIIPSIIIFLVAVFGPSQSIDLIGTLILGLTAVGIISFFILKTRMIDPWMIIVTIILVIGFVFWETIWRVIFHKSVIPPEDISLGVLIITSVLLICFFSIVHAGLFLIRKTGFIQVNLLDKDFYPALRSLCVGLFLGIPWGLASVSLITFNVGTDFYWWEPLVAFSRREPLAEFTLVYNFLCFGLNEEVWARLFLIPIAYILFRPLDKVEYRCWGAIIFVIFVEVELLYPITFWLAVLPYLLRTVLFRSLPLFYLFVRRDFETALGFHLMIEAIPLLLILVTV